MFKNEDLVKLSDESVSFIENRKATEYYNSIVFSYTTKRGKLTHFYLSVRKTDEGFTISFDSTTSSKEIRLRGSMIAHELKALLENSPSLRVRKLTGNFGVSFTYGIEEDIEQYKEKMKARRSAKLKKAEVLAMKEEIMNFYTQSKTLSLKREQTDGPYYEGNVLLVSGREGRYLVDMLTEMNIASWNYWSNNYNLKFNFSDFTSSGKEMMRRFETFLKDKGFNVYIHTWYD